MTQIEKMLKSMLDNPEHKLWYAKDFQSGKNFIGYEATARMSDLIRLYPDLVIVGKDGRFRTLEIDWEKETLINDIKEILESIGEEDGCNK